MDQSNNIYDNNEASKIDETNNTSWISSSESEIITEQRLGITSFISIDEMTFLGDAKTFIPASTDVICARGKHARNHAGNVQYRKLIERALSTYSNAKSKLEKSLIVSSVVNEVRKNSPKGGFVKRRDDKWYEVGDHSAREKVGQSFRDMLHSQYRSSTKAKKRRRMEEKAKIDNEMNDEIQSDLSEFSKRMKIISEKSCSEEDMLQMFNEANSSLLSVLKQNEDKKAAVKKRQQDKILKDSISNTSSTTESIATSTTSKDETKIPSIPTTHCISPSPSPSPYHASLKDC